MADTGAPWNLAYPVSSDLVKDGAAAIQDLAEDVAAALDTAYVIGQVVQAVKTDTFTTTSSTFTTVTGLSVSITPTANTHKVLVIAQVAVSGSNANAMGHFKVTRGGTDIYRGDAAGSRVQAVFGGYNYLADNHGALTSNSIVYLDSPATTSATTYRVEARRGNATGTARVNVTEDATDNASFPRGASSITVIEVIA